MIVLKHNTLLPNDLFVIERIMLEISENPYRHSLDYSLLNKTRGEVYGFIAGIFKRMEICQTLGITTSDFLDFLVDIERGYNDNPYHSFYHAVDVAMVLHYMMEKYGMSEYLTRVDLAMIMIAALCHDIGHPGKNNHFEVSCNTEKAKQYNHLSVLESHSSTLTLELLYKHNLLRNIESRSIFLGVPITQQEFKTCVVKMILATDMICHFTLQENISVIRKKINNNKECSRIRKAFQHFIYQKQLKPIFPVNNPFDYFENHYFTTSTVRTKKSTDFFKNLRRLFGCACIKSLSVVVNNNEARSRNQILSSQERLMMCKILIHAADISNPCRPWSVFYQLSRLVCVEFFRQGEEERSLELSISPNMNQHEASPSSINVGFIDFIVQPYFEALSALFLKCGELVKQCTNNRREWVKLSTEIIDISGDILLPIEVALGGLIATTTTHVVITAGTGQIPGYVEQDVCNRLNRSVSLDSKPSCLLPHTLGENNRLQQKFRRKSE